MIIKINKSKLRAEKSREPPLLWFPVK